MSVIGINIGNENSYIAVARAGGIEILANEYSQRFTPSYVAFKENMREMGTAAKSNHIVNLKGTLFCFKRLLAVKYKDSSILHLEKSFLPYDLCEIENGDVGFKVKYNQETVVFAPQQVTAMMLTKLKSISQMALRNNVNDCVVGVPTYFTDQERRAMIEACLIADIKPITLINEATAIALFYGFYKQSTVDPSASRVVVFIDMGHTSLQVSAYSFSKDGSRVLASVWDKNLGGRNFDIALLNHFSGELKRSNNLDLRNNLKAMTRLLKECEKVKKQMSTNSHSIPLHLECFVEDMDFDSSINRGQFEQLISLHLEILEMNLQKIFKEAKLQPEDIYSVELLGGSTRIPIIKQVIRKVFKKDPKTTLNQDETVVQGCALMGAMLSPTIKVKAYNLNDIQPFDVYLYWKIQGGEDGTLEIFGKNTPIPQYKVLTFEGCQPFSLEFYYNNKERQQRHSKPIITFQCSSLTLAKDMKRPTVAVKISIGHSGILMAEARLLENFYEGKHHIPLTPKNSLFLSSKEESVDPESSEKVFRSGKDVSLDCFYPHLSKHEMENFVRAEAEMTNQDNLEKEKMDAKNSLEEYVYEIRDLLSGRLKDFTGAKDRAILEAKLADLQSWLYQEGNNQTKQVYLAKMEDLRKYSQSPMKRLHECEQRPEALKELGSILQMTAKTVEQCLKGNNTVKPEHLGKVRKWLEEKCKWLDQFEDMAAKLPPQEDPPFTVAQIQQEKDYFEKSIKPILQQMSAKAQEQTAPPDTSNQQQQKA
ncbi:HSPA4L [Cordylochernes scorpioides]|uniref:HSPA4L n=1 Tax=Cordylochernes scorpioides TaxID=51811 RepID=A0ABY6LP78_9ARAC|nr:HSPA4L [Cordylochernes scorpioides]